MKRRDFIALSCAAGLASLDNGTNASESRKGGKQFLELRLYRLANQAKQTALAEFFHDAAVPALNRIGIAPVGLFTPDEENVHDVYVLLPHSSLESVASATQRLLADQDYLKAGEKFLKAAFKDPAYSRFESQLLLAFDKAPKVEIPTKADSRIFQLRIYESHSVEYGQRKIHMFNEGGEVDIFRRVGMSPVFFGESLIGTRLPNLTYMLGFEDRDAGKTAWKRFLHDPAWTKLKTNPFYKNTVSHITNIFLKPVTGSQI